MVLSVLNWMQLAMEALVGGNIMVTENYRHLIDHIALTGKCIKRIFVCDKIRPLKPSVQASSSSMLRTRIQSIVHVSSNYKKKN